MARPIAPAALVIVVVAVVAVVSVASSDARADGPCTVTSSPTWSSTIGFPTEPFAVPGAGGDLPAWVKFTILTCDPSVVYFQDSGLYPFHYDFAVERLDPFAGMSREQFDQVTLHADGQQAILGAVLLPGWSPDAPPPGGLPREIGVQLIRQDAYGPQEVIDLVETVAAAVIANPPVETFYFPTFEQAPSAAEHADELAAAGIAISSAARWATGNPIYAEGWTIGPLTFVPGAEIEAAYHAGQLRPQDVLLTDAVPAEVPFVAGILTLAPSTPNSHVAILASTFGVPFVHLALAADAERALALVGRRVLVRAYPREDPLAFGIGTASELTILDADRVLDEETIALLLELKAPPELEITPTAPFGAISAPVASLGLDDVRHFGGKAANYALLLEAIPAHARVAAALSFDLWNGFLDQSIAPGVTLRDEIAQRLSAYAWPPDDLSALADDLDAIREIFEDEACTSFTEAQRTAIIDTLLDPQYGFDPLQKIRFRSSTNVEDGEHFSGAGLYDSKSGCLADDLDRDDDGPSWCEPDEEPNEKGVFRAIRKVLASFYNENAYLERLRHGIDEDDVGMAILVHHSFPDPIELANGVATFERAFPDLATITMVTQDGAVSVANPEGGAIPEVVEVSSFYGPWMTEVQQYSNLVVLGETVMRFPDDYVQLADLFDAAAGAWENATGRTSGYLLDFEYKRILPDEHLVVKQIRQVPRPRDEPSVTPFLVNQPVEYVVFQGEYGDVLANHRLKSRLRLETESRWLTEESLRTSLHAAAELDFIGDCRPRRITGPLPAFPGATYAFGGNATADGWVVDDLVNPRVYTLRATDVLFLVPPSQPLVVQTDLGFGWRELEVEYEQPVLTVDFLGPSQTTTESVRLIPRPMPDPGDQLQVREVDGPDGIAITTRFHWPPPPAGIVAGYTAPCQRFVDTVIEGLTDEPIVLTDPFAQTYRPEHHNFAENFVFDPWLDPGVTHAQLEALEAMDVRLVLVTGTFDGAGDVTLLSNAELGMWCPPHCAADSDRSGAIDVDDLLAVLLAWGTPAVAPDANSDGTVDVDDLVAVIMGWGPCEE